MSQAVLYHGELISTDGLEPVACALADCSWPLELCRSEYDGTLYFRSSHSLEIDIEMDSGQTENFLFSGGVDGTLDRALVLLGDFSRCLTAGGFTHRVEIYNDARDLVGYFHLKWPQNPPELYCEQ